MAHNQSLFQSHLIESNRIIYTPSSFAKTTLLHLQEVGYSESVSSHTSYRSGLNSYLFFIVEKGSGTLIYHKKKYSVKSGDCVFIDCNQEYSHTSSENDLWTLRWIHFFGTNMRSIYEKYIERGGLPVISPEDIELYSQPLNDIQSLANSDDYIKDMKINEKIASLLTLIMSESWHPENNIKKGSKRQSLYHIKNYLDEHYMDHISLDFLSEQFFINKYYLSRVFKEQFDVTILSYLDQIRISQAKHLLRFSTMTIEEIGHNVGIPDPGYFNRVFKKVEGNTPGEYRKQW